MPEETIEYIRGHWSGLRTVSFIEASVDGIIPLLRSLPMVKEFRLLSSEDQDLFPIPLNNYDWDQPVMQPDTLHLHVASSIVKPLLRAAIKHPTSIFSIQSVKKLTLGFHSSRWLEGLEHFYAAANRAFALSLLVAVAPTLEHLAFRCPPNDIKNWDPVDLTSFKKLRSLSFDIHEGGHLPSKYLPGPYEVAAWWSKNLRMANSKKWTIREIEVNLVLPQHRVHHLRGLRTLDEILGHVDTKRLVFRIRCDRRLADRHIAVLKKALPEHLPVCSRLPHFVFEGCDRFWKYY
ncbi:hypothetical protein CYLTODRAFT_412262 [Cylindrobasidium torrendii FP15055 ss-10]|uniref:F-box domain-containing protein n=1 Tax=Cylindrobasidium torrendii FP15055 ss-10 TaxID=1314674 RepID=A0A0D7B5T7_9AGAR|nr:hypothetical protein CYLTODRAFT_412262 [Cylindrobasidium torrendii FP15055 ss-10]